MSLSGLDSPDVDAAAKAISQERGGWFLLQYVSRDTVEILSQGTKGINEMREAGSKYYGDSGDNDGNGDAPRATARGPLFGMIDFRRRKVLVKLVPEGTSRLVNARVQVHWTSVTSRFPNHDSVFELTSPEQLTESGITAHIELHSGRSSAGSNNKKPVLDGISEEGTEEKVSPLQSSKSSLAAKSVDESSHQVSPLSSADPVEHSKRISSLIGSAAATSAALQRSLLNPQDLAPVPEVSITTPVDSHPDGKDPGRSGSDAQSVLDLSDRRLSTQSGRPSTANEYSSSLYDYEGLYKPKVKLGPRPATASRPASKGNSSAALPTGLRATRPGSIRPKSRDSTYSAFKIPPPPIPESSPLDFMPRPRSSGNSVKSLPATLPKSPGMTREKQRLMKFREMYKEKENKRAKEKAASQGPQQVGLAIEKAELLKTDDVSDLLQLSATISNPAEELPGRLSVISEAATSSASRSLPISAANTPKMDKQESDTFSENRQTLTASAPLTVRSSPEPEKELNTPDLSKDEDGTFGLTRSIEEPRPSGDSMGPIPTSSPVSMMDSSEKTTSTRATSISEHSEAAKPEGDVETPTQTKAGDDDDSQSSTPTAAPLEEDRHLSSETDSKDKRRVAISPITIPTETAESETDGEHSYDDELMDELDGAEVQEASYVSVSKSPITPFFSRRPSAVMTPNSNSPASFVLNGMTPSPLPSPMTPQIERRLSGSPVLSDRTNVTRRPSGSLLSKEIEIKPVDERPKENWSIAQEASASKAPKAEAPTDPELESHAEANMEDERETAIEDPTDSEQPFPTSQSLQKPESEIPSVFSSPMQLPKEPLISPKDIPASKFSRISASTKTFNSRDRPSMNSPPSLTRSPSATLPRNAFGQHEEHVSVQKRRNLGSGVAAKIADLQRNFSGKSPSGNLQIASGSRQSSIVSIRANSIQGHSSPRDLTPPRTTSSHLPEDRIVRGRALSKTSLRSFESRDTRTSSPPRKKSSGSIGKLDSRRFSTFNNPAIEVTSKAETIQVKATIIRTDQDPQITSSDTKGLGLHNSPLDSTPKMSHVEPHPSYSHPRTSVIVEEPRSPTRTSTDKAPKHRRARSSISSALGLIGIRSPSPPATATENPISPGFSEHGRRSSHTSMDMGNSWRSLRRRASASLSRSPSMTRELNLQRSPSAQGYTSPLISSPTPSSHPGFGRSMSSSSLESAATADPDLEGGHKRKGSRTTRMLKRMSISMSSMLGVGGLGVESGQGSAVETVEEEKWVGADLGEMNVQFPDTLLWKRRYLEIDTQGYLLLKPRDSTKPLPQNASIRSTMTYDKKLERKYHLSQFFPPFAPDMERMEMPYSVVLDLREAGGTLQVAADSGLGQSGVLRVLSEAHRVCSY